MPTPHICLRCSSADISVNPKEVIDQRILDKHTCVACGYVWWEDSAPPILPAVSIRVTQVDLLTEIVASQAEIIDNLMALLEEKK